MKRTLFGAAIVASIMLGTPAMAQSFTYDVTWEPVEPYGGLSSPDGPQYSGGAVKGTYVSTGSDGAVVEGTVKCVGTRQPPGIFAIHLACTSKDEQGTYSLAYGCNWQGEPGPGTPLGCVGALEATDGEFKGTRGGLTMHWYSSEKSVGTGQWYTDE